MVQSAAKTVAAYLAELPPERRKVIETMLKLVRKNLPKGYQETVSYGMISWGIPLSRFPATYNKQPLMYAALAAQKNYYAIYLMGLYSTAAQEKAFRNAFTSAGKKLDMGKSCIRFKSPDDLHLPAIGEVIARVTPDEYIALYEKSRLMTVAGRKKAAKAASTSKPKTTP